ncbi:hypothetical protein JX265_006828 [Neoarthrinium moseri]|uniref:Uncharacterized protein n=1 Tax=Neoarthrinium moseri TaxID=1658444 RepID=A0A9P9WKY8_9PEZI|nr:hypothetical protein JX265_006828 [Neoarthrinium moseri]
MSDQDIAKLKILADIQIKLRKLSPTDLRRLIMQLAVDSNGLSPGQIIQNISGKLIEEASITDPEYRATPDNGHWACRRCRKELVIGMSFACPAHPGSIERVSSRKQDLDNGRVVREVTEYRYQWSCCKEREGRTTGCKSAIHNFQYINHKS